jgi:hypothetical protein
MVIIELDCEFDRFGDALGRHSWSNMLVEPIEEEVGQSSDIFYCNLDTCRSVEKNGGFQLCWCIYLLLNDGQGGDGYGSKIIGFEVGGLTTRKH